MKLTDILREIEDEQGGEQKAIRSQYDLAIQPKSIDDALAALNDIKNYGIYAKNLANQSDRIKVFGPSIPSQKSNAAQNDWNTLSPKERLLKIEEIKSRIERKSDFEGNIIYDKAGEKAWNYTLDLLSKNKDYSVWKEENGAGPGSTNAAAEMRDVGITPGGIEADMGAETAEAPADMAAPDAGQSGEPTAPPAA
jgi:hypothetical protein